MSILQAIVLGVLEGLAEFLPISSTAHLLIASEILKVADSEFTKTFISSLRLGAIMSVALVYFYTIIKNRSLILKMAAAFLPTAIIGLAAYGLIRQVLMENLISISITLILGGIFIILLENYFSKRDKALKTDLKDISYKQAFLIGVFQSLAVIPGLSRSAATIMGGLYMGISRKVIVEFSFIAAIPVMIAATGYDFFRTPLEFSQNEWLVWSLGVLASFITAIAGIKFFLNYIKNNNFKIFGWYRIIIGSLVILWQLL